MALTVSMLQDGESMNFGNMRAVVAQVTFDSSYPTGGEAITAAQLQMGRLLWVSPSTDDGYVIRWDRGTGKLLAYEQTDPAAAGGANIPLVEVGATTDLSNVVVELLVVGQ